MTPEWLTNLLKRWTIDSFFTSLDKHAKDSSKPVVDCLYDIDEKKKQRHTEATGATVKAIESLEKTVRGQQNEIINPEAVTNPIVEAQNATIEAIKSIPEVHIPKFDVSSLERKMEELKVVLDRKEMKVNIGKTVFDTKSIIDAIEKIKLEVPKMEKQEIIDYTMMLDEQMSILESIRDKKLESYSEELGAILEWLKVISEKQYPVTPSFEFSDTGRLKVEIDRTASGGNVSNINNASGKIINPATEENQDPLARYKDAGMDVSGSPMYFGFIALDGSWYIKRLDTSTGTTYVKGSSNYTTAWGSRNSLSYDLFNLVF